MRTKTLCLIFVYCVAFSSFGQKKEKPSYAPYTEMISADELSAHLHFIASDFFGGREAGSKHEHTTALYLASYYKALGIPAPLSKYGDPLGSYLQEFSYSLRGQTKNSRNVLAFIEGSGRKDEVVILVAHYDHIGTDHTLEGDSIFNGAADDGSGTVALMEIAESLIEAKKQGYRLNRSVLILHTGAEEQGLKGSSFFVENPAVIPLEKIAAVVNLDGVAGTDKPGSSNADNYIYLLYNDSTAFPLGDIARKLNIASGLNLEILKPSNPERFISDNRPFEYELIPALYFSTGLTEHYHKVSDEPHTINYGHMEKIVRLIFATTIELANQTITKPSAERAAFQKTGTYYCPPCGCKSDSKDFSEPGICPDCGMAVQPQWKKK